MLKSNLFSVSLTKVHLSIHSRGIYRLSVFLYIKTALRDVSKNYQHNAFLIFKSRSHMPTTASEACGAGDSYETVRTCQLVPSV